MMWVLESRNEGGHAWSVTSISAVYSYSGLLEWPVGDQCLGLAVSAGNRCPGLPCSLQATAQDTSGGTKGGSSSYCNGLESGGGLWIHEQARGTWPTLGRLR